MLTGRPGNSHDDGQAGNPAAADTSRMAAAFSYYGWRWHILADPDDNEFAPYRRQPAARLRADTTTGQLHECASEASIVVAPRRVNRPGACGDGPCSADRYDAVRRGASDVRGLGSLGRQLYRNPAYDRTLPGLSGEHYLDASGRGQDL